MVAEDSKSRFSFAFRASDGTLSRQSPTSSVVDDAHNLYICANQGHSIPGVVVDMVQLSESDFSNGEQCIHGTYRRHLSSILEHGLLRGTRHHIHFASGMAYDTSVRSGMRKDCEIFVHVDVIKAMRCGFSFFRSENGVILCSGDDSGGALPKDYFLRIEDATGARLYP